VPGALQLPAVNQVADDVEVVGFIEAEEFEERRDLGVFGAEVDVRNPDGSVAAMLGGVVSRVVHNR
jgi:hypothetical protein